VVDLIEPLAERGHGRRAAGHRRPLTARIICEQLGFDWSEVGAVKVDIWTKAVLDQIGRMQTREDMLENAKVMCELQNFIIRYIEDREKNPCEDMISDIVHAELADGENPGCRGTSRSRRSAASSSPAMTPPRPRSPTCC
jgi:cytochrome P450